MLGLTELFGQGAHDLKLLSSYRNDSNGFEYALGKLMGRGITFVNDLDGNGTNEIVCNNVIGSESEILVAYLNADLSIRSVKEIGRGKSGLPSNLNGYLAAMGYAIDRIPDLDKDGVDELVVGNWATDQTSSPDGEVFIMFLDKSGNVKKYVRIGEGKGGLDTTFSNNEQFGIDVASIGDVNKDGIPDIAVGSIHGSPSANQPGGVWILLLNSNGTVKDYHLISGGKSSFSALLSNEGVFGSSIAWLGDYNNDGLTDIAIGESRSDLECSDCGAIWLLSLTQDGRLADHKTISASTHGIDARLKNGSVFGFTISSGFSLDTIPTYDLVTTHEERIDGRVYTALDFIYLKNDGTIKEHITIIDELKKYQYTFGHRGGFGWKVEIIPDLNGDDKLDLLVNASTSSVDKKSDVQGKFYIFSMDGPIVTDVTPKPQFEGDIALYPNPTNSTFQVSGLEASYEYQLNIHSASGQQLYHRRVGGQSQVSLTKKLQPGMYYITLTNSHQTHVKKLIVN